MSDIVQIISSVGFPDNYNYLKQGLTEADRILEDLDLDKDSD